MDIRTELLVHRRLGRLFYCLLPLLVALAMSPHARAASTTLVQDVIYRADGQPAAGTLLISWPGFTTADNLAVAAGSMTVVIGPQGAVSINLVPNAGGTPDGTYYRVVYKLNDGSTSEENWAIPATGTTTIAAVRSKIVPAGVAMQTASRQYVDTALGTAVKLCTAPNAQTCIDAISATGGTVYLGASTHTGAITLPDNGKCVNLVGAGIDLTVLTVNAPATAVVAKGNTSLPLGCRIQDLTIDGNLQATYGMQLQKGKGWQIERVKVKRVTAASGEGVVLGESSGTNAEFYETRIRDLSIAFESSDYAAGARPLNGLHLLATASDNQISDFTGWNMSNAGVVDDAGDNQYNKIHVYGFPLLTYYPSYAMEITGNAHITQLTSDGVTVGGVHVRGNGNSITNSTFQWPSGGQVSGAFPVVADAGTDSNLYRDNVVRGGSGLAISGVAAVFAKIGTSYFPGNNTEIAGNANYNDSADGPFANFYPQGFYTLGQGTPLGGFTFVTPFNSQPTIVARLKSGQTADLFKCLSTDASSPLCRIDNAGNATFTSVSAPLDASNVSSGTLGCARMPALSGDAATSAGSCATTVAKVNGASVPAAAAQIGTNSSGQLVDARLAHVSLTGQGISSQNGQTFFTCGAAGQYRVHLALYTQTAGSSGTVQVNITYNTGYGTANLYSGTIQLNSTGNSGQATGNMPFHCGANQTVTYTATVTCSSCGSPTWGLDLVAYQDQ